MDLMRRNYTGTKTAYGRREFGIRPRSDDGLFLLRLLV